MRLRTLGGLALEGSGFSRPKPLLLLAYLALEGGKGRRYLAELFWPGATDPMHSLRTALMRLRQSAPDILEGDDLQLGVKVACDARQVLEAVEKEEFKHLKSIYTGPFLQGFHLEGLGIELEEWIFATREFIAGRVREGLLKLAEHRAAEGRFKEATTCAENAYLLPGARELEPEELTRVHALLAEGNSPHLARLRKDAQEYGIEFPPSHAAAREQLRRPLGGPNSGTPSQRLPTRGTSFIGREIELIEVADHLTRPDCSLLTLTGPGGVGKTRLSICAAHDLSEHYPDGVYFVPLEALSDASLISSSIAGPLNLSSQESEDPFVQVTRYVGNKAMLLVLDNYEHLLESTTIVTELLHACPNLKLLVTSRERLNLEEEWVMPLEGLAVPVEDLPMAQASYHDAIKLFVGRAKRVRLSFELTPEELPHAVRICRQVRGLPLGIELAAAWVKMLSCQEIAREIEHATDFLTSTSRNVPERHRSIRAVFEGSWRLLTPKEQGLFRKLSVFSGGFKREAAAEVAGATIPLLASLVDKSLLSITGGGRYNLHPLMHQYTQEKLSKHLQEQKKTKDTHASYYLRLAESAAGKWDTPSVNDAIELLEREHDNLRAALGWARGGGDLTFGLQLAGSLWRFWRGSGYINEGRQWLGDLLEQPSDEGPDAMSARVRALHGAAWLASDQHDFEQARLLFRQSADLRYALGWDEGETNLLFNEALEARATGRYGRALTLLEDALSRHRASGNRGSSGTAGTGLALYELALVLREQGNFVRAAELYQECLEFHRAIGDSEGAMSAVLGLGDVARDQGDPVGTRQYSEPSLTFYRDLGIKWAVGFALNNIAQAACMEGDFTQARTLIDDSEALFRGLKNDGGLAEVLITKGQIQREQGQIATAYETLTEALQLAQQVGPRLLVAAALEGLSAVTIQLGQVTLAAQLLSAAAALRKEMGAPIRPVDRPFVDRALSTAQSMLGHDKFTVVWSEAREVPLERLLGSIPGVRMLGA